MVAEDEVATAKEGDSVHLTKGTQTFGKKEPSEEGRASMSNKVGKPGHLPATIVGKLATVKRSAERRRVSWGLQAGNSPITPLTPNTTIMVDCL